jgi:hypothetical protein
MASGNLMLVLVLALIFDGLSVLTPRLCRLLAISADSGRARAWKRSICSTLVPVFLASVPIFTCPFDSVNLIQIAVLRRE